MKVKYKDSLEYKARNRLRNVRGSVVLRRDFQGLGSYRQISRVLQKLIIQKKLVRIGSGVFAKSYLSTYTDVPLIKNGTDSTLRSALERLGVAYERGTAEKRYNEGKSTQVPVKNIVRLMSRCRRRLGYLKRELIFEGDVNAK